MSSSTGIDQLRSIEQQFDRERESVVDLRTLEDIRTRFLSRKSGLLTVQLQNLKNLPAAERAEFGRAGNVLKAKIEGALAEMETAIALRAKADALVQERLDVTLPGKRRAVGRLHPLTIV